METVILKPTEDYLNLSKETACHEGGVFISHTRDEISSSNGQQQQTDNLVVDKEFSRNIKVIAILRDLLAIERSKNQRRKQNGYSMRRYLKQLQDEYLALQKETLEILETAHKVTAQKDAQIDCLNDTIGEREQLIERQKLQLDVLEPTKVKQDFEELSKKQNELFGLERKQLLEQINTLDQQLVRERIANSQTLLQIKDKYEQETQRYEKESDKLRSRINELERELAKILEEPKSLLIKTLREEKSQLQFHLENLTQEVSGSKSRHEILRERAKNLCEEQELLETNNREELERLEKELTQQRTVQQDLKLQLQDKEEIIQILQFNVQRSERRSNCLLRSIRSSELAYKDALSQLEIKHEKVVGEANVKAQNLELRLIHLQDESNQRQNELVRTRLEQEAQIDALRNDRNDRLNRLAQEKQTCEKKLQASELKLAKILNIKEQKDKQFDELQRDLNKFTGEAKRLSLELTKNDAKLFSKQRELRQALDDREARHLETEDKQQLILKLEDTKRQASNLQRAIKQLRVDNESLRAKLRLSEDNLIGIGSAIQEEHANLMHDYKKRLEEIRQKQVNYDRNKTRYKKYGIKIKKYCEHLSKVHMHLCNPSTCGYSLAFKKLTG